jgi:predicted CXXCH cytochrome family protein
VSPLRRLLIGAIVAVAAAAGYAGGRAAFRPTQRVVQPIAFNHQKHVRTLEIDCSTCHEFYETGSHAGLPTLTTCQGCHAEPLTDSPEEAKIFELVKAGKVDVFRKLFRLPDHAFYTHRRHVVVAKLPCERCHGAIADTTSPPERPLVRISMEFCLGCHQSSGASSACTSCHR